MRLVRSTIVAVLMLTPLAAHAQERAGDAALGAFSGAIVFGPVGLVAGLVVGFTAGPSISRSWRHNHYHPRRVARGRTRPTRVAARPRASAPPQPEAGSVTPQTPAPGTGGPPAQGFE